MSTLEALYAIIASYFKANQIEIYSQVAKVTAVDKSEYSCEIELLRGGKRKHARITATLDNGSGIVVFPKQNSKVIVSFIDQTTVFITKYSDIDDIIFFEGKNGGMVLVNSLLEKINRLENKMMSHQHQYITAAGSPAPTTPDPATNPTFKTTTLKDIENTKIKQ